MRAIDKLMVEANKVNAPIEIIANPKKASWRQSSLGQTFSPRKDFIDLRNGRKISLAQAKQVVGKYKRLNGA